MAIKNIIVTGSSGTVGTRLCERLVEEGYEVTGVDIRPNAWNAEIDRRTRIVDLRYRDAVAAALPKNADLVIHLAANARVYDLVRDPVRARDNAEMTFNVLEFARSAGVPRVAFSSSREVYGNSDRFVHAEDDMLVRHCESPYTASKISDESMLWAYHRCYKLDILIFRFSNVYGMYDDSDRVVPLFYRLARRNEPLCVFGREKTLDFTYIDDTIDGVCRGIARFEDVRNREFNIASGEGTSIASVAERIKALTGSGSGISYRESRIGEVLKYVADISRARELLGYEPATNIEEGLRKSVAWYRNAEAPAHARA
jgi:UDP-glucose 4-epimerase